MNIIDIDGSHEVLNKYKKLKKNNDDFIILESEKVILYAHKLGIELIEIVTHNDFYEKLTNIKANTAYRIDKNILSNIIGYKSHSGVFALASKPKIKDEYSDRVIILDNLTSPENVGSICRSASAFGFNTVIYNSKGTSPFLRRCIRVSTGHVLNLNIIKSRSLTEDIKLLRNSNFQVICSHNSKDAETLDELQNKEQKIALVIGSEGHGVSQEVISCCTNEVKISTDSSVEHLNASNAASIMMHHFKKI